MALAPRVFGKSVANVLFGFGLDRQHDAVPVGKGAAENDDAAVDELVHERCVRGPVALLLHRPRAVPFGPGVELDDVKHRHAVRF